MSVTGQRQERVDFPIGDLPRHLIDRAGELYNVVTLAPVDATVSNSPIPELYKPVLHDCHLARSGSSEDSAGYFALVQEWLREAP